MALISVAHQLDDVAFGTLMPIRAIVIICAMFPLEEHTRRHAEKLPGIPFTKLESNNLMCTRMCTRMCTTGPLVRGEKR